MRVVRIVGCVLALSMALAPLAVARQEEPGPPHETNLTVGEAPPTGFSLESIGEQTYELGERGDRPLLLLFFRGTW